MTEILLARHGETDWNREVRWQGHADRPLTQRGLRQARELARRLATERLDAVYASDLLRAAETARMIADPRRATVHLRRDLREIDVGSWSGLTTDQARERFPEGFRRWQAYEGAGWDDGETYDELAERVARAIEEIAFAHPGGRVLVVTHGGPIRAMHARALGISQLEARRTRAVLENCHLSRLLVQVDTASMAVLELSADGGRRTMR